MATQRDVDGKQFVWVWLERVEPKKARVPDPGVIALPRRLTRSER